MRKRTKAEKINDIKEVRRRICPSCGSNKCEIVVARIFCYSCDYKENLLADILKRG